MQIEEVHLDIVLPDTGIGIVIMQPFVELTLHEPYQWIADKKPIQIARIVRTLEISKNADHGCDKTHFTIFPEYSIPGLEGIQRIQTLLEDASWQNGTIVIGGIDGLTKEAYATLCGQANTVVNPVNQPDKVRNDQWVNCAIVWSKQNDIVTRWLQPKIIPAAQEELCPASHMFEGRFVYIFKPQISLQNSLFSYRFFCLICKDWIGNVGANRVIDEVLAEIDRNKGLVERLDIYLGLILKRNPDPDFPLFFNITEEYLNETTHVGVRRAESSVFFINNAGKEGPGLCGSFGKSGFVFHPNCSFVTHEEYCPPTYTLKKRNGFPTCKEARFRENGSCITSFKFIPPITAIVRRSPATTRIPINPAIVHSIDDNLGVAGIDPRIAGREVPASVKWINDQLDTIDSFLHQDTVHPLRGYFDNAHQRLCQEVRVCPDRFLRESIERVTYNYDKRIDNRPGSHNVDDWDIKERIGLETLVHSLSFIGCLERITIKDAVWHGLMTIDEPGKGKRVVDIIILAGGHSHKENLEYLEKINFVAKQERKAIIISRPNPDKPMTVLDKKIYDTDTNVFRSGFHELSGCSSALDETQLVSEVKRVIGDLNG